MRKIHLMSLVLIVLLIFMSGPALAQTMPVFCGDLAEADCTLLKDSQTAMAGLHSGAAQLDVAVSVSNIPDSPFEQLDFGLTGDGTFAIDPALMESMMAMQSDPSALFSTPEAFMDWFSQFLKGFSGDLNLTLHLPAELTAMMSSEDQTIPENLSIGLRFVDGFAYANLASIAESMPDAGVPAGWVGIDLATLMEQNMAQSGFGGMEGMDPEVFKSYMQSFQDPAFLSEFMTIERLADIDVMGQQAAVFQYTFDYPALFQSDVFKQMMQAQMEAVASMSGSEMDSDAQAEMDKAMEMMGPMFEGMTLEMRQTIGLDDKFAHSTEMKMAWDMSGFMAAVEPDSEGPAPTFTFDMTVNASDFNAAPEIVAPEDATIFPIDSMVPSNDM
ncbi:MAG: hypothetical protein K8J31_04005 [Anaerolineae bacterium]|nr:hypothetical protein [Anaerolineae bacterium]